MADWQTLIAWAVVLMAAVYVLRTALAACGLLRTRSTRGCGGCAKCPVSQMTGNPAGTLQAEPIQVVSITLPGAQRR